MSDYIVHKDNTITREGFSEQEITDALKRLMENILYEKAIKAHCEFVKRARLLVRS